MPDVVAFIGATDRAAAEAAVRKLVAHAESEGSPFTETQTRGHLSFMGEESDDLPQYIVLTDDYIVFATSEELLSETRWTGWSRTSPAPLCWTNPASRTPGPPPRARASASCIWICPRF